MYSYNFKPEEVEFILRTLNDPRAFNYGTWYQTKRESMAHWKIIKASSYYIESIGGSKHMSATVMSDPKEGGRLTLFNAQNWNALPEALKYDKYTLEEYRQYLVLHEFGHALASLRHPNIKSFKNGQPAPIMYQQTLGLKVDMKHISKSILLKKNVWPLLYERQMFFKDQVY